MKDTTREDLKRKLTNAYLRIAGLEKSLYEQNRIKEAIKGSEDRFRKFVENAHDVLWVFDLNLGYTYVSPSVKRLRGYTVEEAMKQSLDQILTPGSVKKARDLFERERLLEITGHHHGPDWSLTTEFEEIRKDGSTFWAEIVMTPRYDEKGRIKDIMGITRDISERKHAEITLNESEKRYRLLAENARDVIWVLDENLRYTYVSPSVMKLRGYAQEEVMTQTMEQVLSPDSYRRAMEIFLREFELEKSGHKHEPDWSMTLDIELICKDESTVWTEVNISLIYDESGNPTGILGVTRDISERKRAEGELKKHQDQLEELVQERTLELIKANEKLRKEIKERKEAQEKLQESEEKYRMYFSLSNDVMFSYDNEFRVRSVSPNAEKNLGYKPEELIGKTFLDAMVLHPDYMEEAIKNAVKVLSGQPVHSSIYEFITKEGLRKFGEVSGVPLIRNNRVVGEVTVARDITERIRMQRSLQESEERYRTTLQGLPEAVSIMRMDDCRYIYMNEAFCKMSGYAAEEVMDRTPFDLNLFEASEDLAQSIGHLQRKESINSKGYQCHRKDGTIIDTIISFRPIFYDGKDSIIMVMTDISFLKKIAEEKKRLEFTTHKMEAIGTLASGIAHDFNNILTTIIGYTKMSLKDFLAIKKEDKDLSAVRSDLNEVRNAANRARDLVNHILAFSRHSEKDYSPIVIGSTIRESLKLLQPSLPGNIRVHENLPDEQFILGDAKQIHLAMTNLCTNAVHAMNETGGDLDVSLLPVHVDGNAALDLDLPAGNYLKLTVRDTGHGMSPKVITCIFDPYFTTKWRSQGTGLGLSIVHGIIKSHGGAISCTSAPGEGTTFAIYLPEYRVGQDGLNQQTGRVQDQRKVRILDLDDHHTHVEVKGKDEKIAHRKEP